MQHISLRFNKFNPPAFESITAATQFSQIGQRPAQTAFGAVPVVKRPVKRVAVTLHGDFIAVVDAGHTGQRKDQRIGKEFAAHSILHAGQRDAATALPETIPAVGRFICNGGNGTLSVMGG